MTTHPNSLARIAALRQRQCDQAAAEVMRARAAVDRAKAQLHALDGYAADYRGQTMSGKAWQLQSRKAFGDRLGAMRLQQIQLIERTERDAARALEAWHRTRQAQQSMQRAADQQQADATHHRNKRQQQIDEDRAHPDAAVWGLGA